MFTFFVRLFIACLIGLTIGCSSMDSPGFSSRRSVYTFGDASYDSQLQSGVMPVKYGPIPADMVPANFPRQYLEADGSYGGGRVFTTKADAHRAVRDAMDTGVLSPNEHWGIYEVDADWTTHAYELKPNDYRLNQSARVIKRVD